MLRGFIRVHLKFSPFAKKYLILNLRAAHALKALEGGIALLIRNLSTRWKWVVNFTSPTL